MNNIEQKANSIAMRLSSLIYLALIIGYGIEFINTSTGHTRIITIISLCFTAFVLSICLYKKFSSSPKLKYIIFSLFTIIYVSSTFTTTRTITYAFALPMIGICFIYSNIKFLSIVNSLIFLINLIRSIIFMSDPSIHIAITDYVTQLSSILLIWLGIHWATKFIISNTTSQIDEINKAKLHQDNLIKNLYEISQNLDTHAKKMLTISNENKYSSQSLTDAISNITDGIASTVDNIKSQTNMTTDIHSMLQETLVSNTEVNSLVNNLITSLSDGKQFIDKLTSESDVLNSRSEVLYKEMLDLKKHASEIETIIQTITSISSQTNILSLNAAIESARAGEFGKGFSVVAQEVRHLSLQTDSAVMHISNILNSITIQIEQSVSELKLLRDSQNIESTLIKETDEIFSKNHLDSLIISKNTTSALDKINDAVSSNNTIVKSIEQISSTSEDCMAHIEETNSISIQNSSNITEMSYIAEELASISEYIISVMSKTK